MDDIEIFKKLLKDIYTELSTIIQDSNLEKITPSILTAWNNLSNQWEDINKKLNELERNQLETVGLTGTQLTFKREVFEKIKDEPILLTDFSSSILKSIIAALKLGMLGEILIEFIDMLRLLISHESEKNESF